LSAWLGDVNPSIRSEYQLVVFAPHAASLTISLHFNCVFCLLSQVIRATHALLCAPCGRQELGGGLELDPFEDILAEANLAQEALESKTADGRTVNASRGRILDHFLLLLMGDLISNYAFNTYTQRFVRTPVPMNMIDFRKAPANVSKHMLFGQLFKKVLDNQAALMSEFVGEQHIRALIELSGGYSEMPVLLHLCGLLLLSKIKAVLTYSGALENILSRSFKKLKATIVGSSTKQRTAMTTSAIFSEIQSALREISSYGDMKREIFQAIREVGNICAFIKLLSSVLSVSDFERTMTLGPLGPQWASMVAVATAASNPNLNLGLELNPSLNFNNNNNNNNNTRESVSMNPFAEEEEGESYIDSVSSVGEQSRAVGQSITQHLGQLSLHNNTTATANKNSNSVFVAGGSRPRPPPPPPPRGALFMAVSEGMAALQHSDVACAVSSTPVVNELPRLGRSLDKLLGSFASYSAGASSSSSSSSNGRHGRSLGNLVTASLLSETKQQVRVFVAQKEEESEAEAEAEAANNDEVDPTVLKLGIHRAAVVRLCSAANFLFCLRSASASASDGGGGAISAEDQFGHGFAMGISLLLDCLDLKSEFVLSDLCNCVLDRYTIEQNLTEDSWTAVVVREHKQQQQKGKGSQDPLELERIEEAFKCFLLPAATQRALFKFLGGQTAGAPSASRTETKSTVRLRPPRDDTFL
jgi:hypothetical protein